ncbi:threonine/serine ThrE exporter family protein [Streptomyces atriruber]|uniref:threonine/serine ThrE exporter family protein n=1 Tax=Streptomyces atriruber TaxID=545121 RepID=UPI0006E31999|nr:threonine/serine exporter family protein [Streptomyces atriruber]
MGEGGKPKRGKGKQEGAEVLDRLKHTAYDGTVKTSAKPLSQRDALRVMDFALRLGQELFLSGFDTQDIESSVIAASVALGLNHLDIDITARTLHLQYAPPNAAPMSMMRVTRTVEDPRDLRRMAALHRLVGHVVEDGLDVRQAAEALRRIQSAPPPWPWWSRTAGSGILAAALTVQVGGSAWAALMSVAVVLICDRAGWLLQRSAMPFFLVIAAQAALTVVLGIALLNIALIDPYSTAVVTANLVVLLPLGPLIALPQDGITGFSLMAATRAVNVALALAGMATGVVLVAVLADQAAADLYAPHIDHTVLPVWGILVMSAVGALGNCCAMGGSRRQLPFAVTAGLLAGSIHTAVTHAVPDAQAVAVLCAATALGASAALCSPLLRVPAAVIVVPGAAGSLLPSLQVYESITQLSVGRDEAVQYALLGLVSTSAIGVGVVTGAMMGNAALRTLRRFQPTPQPQ